MPFATTATYNTTLAFNMSEATLPLRVVADHTLVEVFVGGGRGVVSTPVLVPGKSPDNGGVFFSAPAAPYTVASASAWRWGVGGRGSGSGPNVGILNRTQPDFGDRAPVRLAGPTLEPEHGVVDLIIAAAVARTGV